MQDLRGKRALVTGAARGIGRRISLRLAQLGAEVIVTDLCLADAEKVAEEIRAGGGRAQADQLDVTDHEAIAALRRRIHDDSGPIEILVNNAGTVFGGAFLDVPLEKHELTYRVNVLGLMAMTHAFLPDLIAAPEGYIVHIASASGFIGLPYGTTYASSKWAVIGFSESIRLELAELGHRHVGVTAVCPSFVDTGLFAGVQPPKFTRMLSPQRLTDQIIRAIRRDQPLLLTPWLVHIAPALSGLIPTRWLDWVGRAFGASTSMLHWRGHAASPDQPDAAAEQASSEAARPEHAGK